MEIEVWGTANTAYVGNYFEWMAVKNTACSTNTMTKYYYAGGQRVAVRRGSTLSLLFGDHLGSTANTADPITGRRWTSLRYKAWGEQRYAEGAAPTEFHFTGQREQDYIKLIQMGSRWYDPVLGRWTQPDIVVPLESQGVQAWDRYAYVNNNPVRYNDPTGHDVGCAGRDASECKKATPVCPMETPNKSSKTKSVATNSIILKGGPGATTSYGKSAEDSWTGFEGSGESSNPIISGLVGAPGLINDVLTWGRDNTNIRERWLGSQPEVSGNVYYELGVIGFSITGVSITNSSYESIKVTQVYTISYSSYQKNNLSGESLYPPNYFSIHTADYGVAQPGLSSGIVNMTPNITHYSSYLDISIWVRSESGRFGSMGVSFSVTPP